MVYGIFSLHCCEKKYTIVYGIIVKNMVVYTYFMFEAHPLQVYQHLTV